MFAVVLIGVLLASAYAPFSPTPGRPSPFSQWIHLFLLVPIAEELYFRGLFLEHLERGFGAVWAVVLCSMLLIIPTFCFGALFPVSVALYSRDPKTIGSRVGRLYLANTAGNVIGSFSAGFLLIPAIGIHKTIMIAVSGSGLIGLAAILIQHRLTLKRFVAVALPAIVLGCGLWNMRNGWEVRNMTGGLHILPYSHLDKYSTEALADNFDEQVLFYREGLTSIVSVNQNGEHRALKINGKADASTGIDLHTQYFLGHLPLLLHPDPKRTLVIGLGSGATLAACAVYPVDEIDCIEIKT